MKENFRQLAGSLIFTILTISAVISGAERDRSLLFEASFDDFSANAEYAAGDRTVQGLPESDLQLRMFPGIGPKSNALVLDNSETCRWALKDNLNPKQGTVSLWIRNLNWKMNMAEREMFFYAYQNDFQILIWKAQAAYLNVLVETSADGKKQGFTLAARVDPEQWNTEKWHKLDLTWDKSEFKLYLDGAIPPRTPVLINEKAVPPTVPQKKFPPDIVFPDGRSDGMIGIGLWWIWKKSRMFDPGHRTAFNKLKIYSRVLSPSEIFQDYQTLVPENKIAPNLASIPLDKREIQLDGVLEPSEWQNAERFLLLEKLQRSLPGNIRAFAMAYQDDQNLYLGFSASEMWKEASVQQADGPLWEDDSFEFHLHAGDIYQFIVNANGAVYDSRNADPKWNSGVKAAAARDGAGWSAELVIPLHSLGNPSGDVKGNFGFTAHQGQGCFFRHWSNQVNDMFYPNSLLKFARTQEPVRLAVDGSFESGLLILKSEGAENNPVSARIVSSAGTELECPGRLDKAGWKAELKEGVQVLTVSGSGFRQTARFVVQSPMEMVHNSNPLKKIISLDFNFTNSGAEIRAELEKGLPVKVDMLSEEGEIIHSSVHTLEGIRSQVAVPFPEQLKQGNYRIRAEAVCAGGKPLAKEIPFRVPDLRPYSSKIGLDDSVPPPWTPVVNTDGRRFEVLDRIYTFDGASPFPQSVLTRNTETLASPPCLALNRERVRWQPYKIAESGKDHVTLTGRGEADGARFDWTGELWFDGMYKLDLTVIPLRMPLEISDMSIRYATTPAISLFALNPLYMPWQKDGTAGIPLGPAGRKDNLIWLSSHECGFAAWVKSNANWVNHPDEKVMTARKNGSGGAEVALNIITVAAKLEKNAAYTFVFMATPPRRPTEPPRSVNYHGYNMIKHNNYQSICWGCFEKTAYPDDTTSINSLIPADPDKWKKSAAFNPKGKRAHLYSMPGHVADTEADCDYLGADLRSFPLLSHSGIKLGKQWTTYQYCGNASDLAADLWCWNFERNAPLFKGFDYDGIYFDIGAVRFCSSKAHGCAGTDAFGGEYISSDALGLRNFYMRVYKTVKKHGGTIMLHSHVQFVPFVQDFCDMFSPGENTFYTLAQNLKYGYLEGISPEEYQTDFNWRKAGVAYQIIPQTARAAVMIPSLKHMENTVRRDPAYTNSAIAAFAVHDLNLWASSLNISMVDRYWKIRADFNIDQASDYVGYWRPDCFVKSDSPKVLCGYYRWDDPAPYRYVLVISNFNREDVPLRLRIDWQKMELDPNRIELTDLWNQKAVTAAELSTRILGGASFLLIGVK